MMQNDEINLELSFAVAHKSTICILLCVVLSECGEVYGRLFDHKPVVRGEINFFLREFEVSNCIYLSTELYQSFVI